MMSTPNIIYIIHIIVLRVDITILLLLKRCCYVTNIIGYFCEDINKRKFWSNSLFAFFGDVCHLNWRILVAWLTQKSLSSVDRSVLSIFVYVTHYWFLRDRSKSTRVSCARHSQLFSRHLKYTHTSRHNKNWRWWWRRSSLSALAIVSRQTNVQRQGQHEQAMSRQAYCSMYHTVCAVYIIALMDMKHNDVCVCVWARWSVVAPRGACVFYVCKVHRLFGDRRCRRTDVVIGRIKKFNG